MKNFKKIVFTGLVLGIILLPILSFAQNSDTLTTPASVVVKACNPQVNDIGDIICRIGYFLNKIVPLLLTLGVIYFVWGVVSYMIGADEEQKEKGRNKIIYGLIGLVVIVSLWGIVSLVISGFGLDSQESTIINPSNIIDTNLQVSNSDTCYNNFVANKPIISDLFNYVTCIIGSSIIPLLFILAVASFIWGVVQYVINDEEEAKKEKGRSFMIWGIVALTVMVSIWGLVQILGNTFNIDTTFVPQVKSN